MMADSIQWVDSEGAASLSNGKPDPATRFGNWTPSRRPIGPAVTAPGTGRLHRFEFRRDDLIRFEIAAIPGTEANLDLCTRLEYHLLNGGVVTPTTDRPLASRFATCSLAEGFSPELDFSDRQLGEYTFSVTLKGGVTPSDADIIPTYFADAILWLQPESLSSLDDATNFGLWPDVSGFNNDATQPTTGNYPEYRKNIINGLGSVYFSGGAGGRYFKLPLSMFTSVTEAEIFIVMKRDVDPPLSTATAAFHCIGAASSFVPSTDGKIYDGFGTDVQKDTGIDPTADLTNPHIYGARSAAGAWANYLDGSELYSTATNSVGWFNSGEIRIGAGWLGGPGNPDWTYLGYFSEIILFPRVRTTTERAAINRYLSSKFAITLA